MSTSKKVSIDFYWKKEKLSGDFWVTYQLEKGEGEMGNGKVLYWYVQKKDKKRITLPFHSFFSGILFFKKRKVRERAKIDIRLSV